MVCIRKCVHSCRHAFAHCIFTLEQMIYLGPGLVEISAFRNGVAGVRHVGPGQCDRDRTRASLPCHLIGLCKQTVLEIMFEQCLEDAAPSPSLPETLHRSVVYPQPGKCLFSTPENPPSLSFHSGPLDGCYICFVNIKKRQR